ncbi:darcynin family protein [Mycolicibacterium sediminis]|uniref:darcynin family protein n=1 Tax=Mycolicibacterium sediminis TaxID=1286180 RepID=UPI0013D04D0C|nr:darcynin family protein [Mycolicibacterium sediminis]
MRREVQETFLDEFGSACFIDGTRHTLNVAVASLMLVRMSQRSRPESAAQPLVCVMHLTALPSWLSMSRVQRQSFVADHVEPLLRHHPGVSVRWIDVEAFSSDCSDVLLADAADLRSWNTFVEALRDTEVFARPLFRLELLNVGIEDGYLDYDRSTSVGCR